MFEWLDPTLEKMKRVLPVHILFEVNNKQTHVQKTYKEYCKDVYIRIGIVKKKLRNEKTDIMITMNTHDLSACSPLNFKRLTKPSL